MALQAPSPVDFQEFQFKLHCRFKIFENKDNVSFKNHCNLLTTASRYGLVFVGSIEPLFKVININTIEKADKDNLTNYNCRTVALPSSPKFLDVNCDGNKLAIIVEKDNCPFSLIYDVTCMLKSKIPEPILVRLSSTANVYVTQISWNPSLPEIFTVCKSDGTLGLYEFKESGLVINELPSDSQATCMCWSPKGKQLAVGSRNGSVTQYKPDLKAVKIINAPPLEVPHSIVALHWVSNYQFIGVFTQQDDSTSSLIIIDAPKVGNPSYINYEDICYSDGNLRPVQFYLILQPVWNILMVASSNSMEVGVLGNEKEKWIQWTLVDSARAELPLSSSKQETLPIGFAFDTASVEPMIWGESSLPPVPFLLLLSHHGLLCCFRTLHMNTINQPICKAPEQIGDKSGLDQFIPSNQSESKIQKSVTSPKTSTQITTLTTSASFGLQRQTPIFVPSSTTLFQPQPQSIVSKPPPSFIPTSEAVAKLTTRASNAFPLNWTPNQQWYAAPSEQSSLFVPKSQHSQVSITPIKLPLSSEPPPLSTTKPKINELKLPPGTKISVVPKIETAAVVRSSNPLQTPTEINTVQEEDSTLISKLIREECERLESELKTLLKKVSSKQFDVGTDADAVKLVQQADELVDYMKDINEIVMAQYTEVYSLKQGLLQTWAWYEDARSRFAKSKDSTLETLLHIQKLDPVSQRYLNEMKSMTYYLESQLVQASRVLDEQWENFQDACKKVIKFKIPTMEAIYQTMVRQSAIYEKQKYILKDISSRIRSNRSKITGSLLISLNNVDYLETELKRLQLEPQSWLQAQYVKASQNRKKLTTNKIKKLDKLLLNREITRVVVNKSYLSNISIHAKLKEQAAAKNKMSSETSMLGVGFSPIPSKKIIESRFVDFTQSTPKATITDIQNVQSKPMISQQIIQTDKSNKISVTTLNNENLKPDSLTNQQMSQLSITNKAFTLTSGNENMLPKLSGQQKLSGLFSDMLKPATSISSTTPSQFSLNVSELPNTSKLPFTSCNNPTAPSSLISNDSMFTKDSITTSTTLGTFTFGTSSPSQTTKVAPAENTVSSKPNISELPIISKSFDFGSYSTKVSEAQENSQTFIFGKTPFTSTTVSSGNLITQAVTFSTVTMTPIISKSATVPEKENIIKSTISNMDLKVSEKTYFQTSDTGKSFNTFKFSDLITTTTVSNFTTNFNSTTNSSSIFSSPSIGVSLFNTTPNLNSETNLKASGNIPNDNIFNSNFDGKSIFAGTTVSITSSPMPLITSFSNNSNTITTSAFGTNLSTPVTISMSNPIVKSDIKINESLNVGILNSPEVSLNTSSGVIAKSNSTTNSVGSSAFEGVTTSNLNFGIPSILQKITTSENKNTASPAVTGSLTSLFNKPLVSTSEDKNSTSTPSIFNQSPFATENKTLTSHPGLFNVTSAISENRNPTISPATQSSTFLASSEHNITTNSSAFNTCENKKTTTTTGIFMQSPVETLDNKVTTIDSGGLFNAVPLTISEKKTDTTLSSAFSTTPSTSLNLATGNLNFGSGVSTSTNLFFSSATPAFGNSNLQLTTPSTNVETVTSSSTVLSSITTTSVTFSTSGANNFFQSGTSPSWFTTQPSIASASVMNSTVPKTPTTFFDGSSSKSVFETPKTENNESPSSPFTPSTTSNVSAFGGSLFGNSQQASSKVFVSPAFATTTFGTFGNTNTTTTTIFGQPAVFQSSSVFGTSAASTNNSGSFSGGSIFGTNASTLGESKPATSFSFAGAAANVSNGSSIFGNSNQSQSVFGFAGGPSKTDSNSFSFGSLSVQQSSTVASPVFGSTFGQSSNSNVNPFAKSSSSSENIFGKPAVSATSTSPNFGGSSTFSYGGTNNSSVFGQPSGFAATSTFGQSSSFGQQNTFGSGTFGTGSFSSGNQSVAQTGFGGFAQPQKAQGFGSTPIFNSSPGFGAPANFGSSPVFGGNATFGSPQKTFGESNTFTNGTQENSTFANLANQSTLGFGSLAQQQSPTNQNMSSFSGGSSFSTWR